ncbi:MAG: hypothetical protein DMG05_02700 [Acidobacteria bacterium]|nr:MAG: hypothetical protein DMG05_02700 [Acidobacteriota bacterium]
MAPRPELCYLACPLRDIWPTSRSGIVKKRKILKQIKQLIKNCLFAVVILDGFRPNVVFEFGMIVSIDRPLILLRENDAKVDVSTYYPNSANLNLTPVTIDLDNHLSDAKDLNYALWSRFKVRENVRLIIQEYEKIMRNRSGYIQIVREDLWFS